MPLVTILPVSIFGVGACIAFSIGVKKLWEERQKGMSIRWYQQVYILMAITSFLLAVFFLLIGLHDIVSEHNPGLRLLIYVVAGIIFTGGVVSCVGMIRYYPFFPPKDET